MRTLRGELAAAGFSWAESFECDHIEAMRPAGEALASGIVDRAYTSQLTVLSDEEFEAGRNGIPVRKRVWRDRGDSPSNTRWTVRVSPRTSGCRVTPGTSSRGQVRTARAVRPSAAGAVVNSSVERGMSVSSGCGAGLVPAVHPVHA